MMKLPWKFLLAPILVLGLCQVQPSLAEEGKAVDTQTVYDFKIQTIDGKELSLAEYKGKVLLIVNTASKCGYTYQYGPLEQLYQKYKDRGFEVLAFPANNFGNQEPGTNEEIKDFCFRSFKTSFPLFAKISVKGGDIHPLYAFLTSQGEFAGPITWNFNKFLISPEGKVVGRFATQVDPLSPVLARQLESVLPNK